MVLNMIFKIISTTIQAYWFIFYSIVVSLIIYASFYVFYLPPSEHLLDVHLQYKTSCDTKELELCSFPSADVLLHKTPKASKDGLRVLTRGQGYDVTMELDMPLSEKNKNLGMFLVQIDFVQKDNAIIESHSRSALFTFQSSLLSTLSTFFYIIPLLTGWREERRTLTVPLVENYIDDSYKPTFAVTVSIHSKKIQIYAARLRFKAVFTGLRYYMHQWPMTFSLFGFLSVLGMVMLFLIYRIFRSAGSGQNGRHRGAMTTDHYGDLSDSSEDEEVTVENLRSHDQQDGNSNSSGEDLTSSVRKRLVKDSEKDDGDKSSDVTLERFLQF